MPHISGIDHIDIVVDNLEEMVTFFKGVGFVETRRTEHTGGSVELRFPGGPDAPILELSAAQHHPKGLRHIALRSADIDADFAEMKAKGLNVLSPPGAPTASGRRVFNLGDPQGTKLQVSTRID